MSRETIVAPAPPPPRQQPSEPEKDAEPENSKERFEEDETDFVLVVNRKKVHQAQTESQRKHRQSYDYTDDEHHQNGNHQGRRRKYRDRGGGEQKERGQRRRDKQRIDKENIHVNKTAATSTTNTALQPSANHQTLPTSPVPSQQSLSQPVLPVQRSFSLVVASGSSSSPQLQTQKGTQTESVVVAQQQVQPPVQVLPDQSNDQENVGRLTNRQILMVVKPKESGGGPSTSSSIPDTSSLTSEETLDSLERKTSGDGDSNEGSSSAPAVEFVDAPVPKINPWVVNRNAAQVITGSSSGSQVALSGFPSVNEVFVDKQPTQMKAPTQPLQQKHQPAEQLPSNRKLEEKKVKKEEPRVQGSPPSPSSFSDVVASPKSFVSKPQPRELPKKEQLPAETSSQPLLPKQNQVETQASVYVREMTNGFRPGRGRGSYSASASAGRRPIPSRSNVLIKQTNDWPALGETQIMDAAIQKLSSGEEESEDAVDSHVNSNKSNEAPEKSHDVTSVDDKGQKSKSPSPAPRQQQHQVETTSSSDNEDEGNASGKQRKGSKQRWVPLPLEIAATQAGGQGEYQAQEYKKAGKGKGKYPSSTYHGGYHQRAKGKENVAINGGNDYSDYPPSHGHQHGRYQSSRGGPHHRSTPLINRGGGNASRHRRHNNYHRSNSTLSLNNHSMINGGHAPAHHHTAYELIPSPTQSAHEFTEYPADFTTLTPMYPAVSEFIMPYVANGYFPTPYTSPAGIIVEPGTEVVPGTPIVLAAAPQPDPTSQVTFSNGVDMTVVSDRVRSQIEYYFSEQNLTKDVYLRRMMDAEGYLSVAILLEFPRMKQLTQDLNILITAIQSSDKLELKPDMTSVRPKLTPERWPIIEPSGKVDDKGFDLKCINNNNTPGGGSGVETLNPNVPEFVPKSKVALY